MIPPGGQETAIRFDYESFSTWYERLARSQLEPARQTLVRLLNEQLDRELSDLDRYRFRISASRVKEPVRLWIKIQQPKYSSKIIGLDDIPVQIDDLVGLRIVCNNLSDISFLHSMLDSLPDSQPAEQHSIALEAGSLKDYVSAPKPTGYRAFHANLFTIVPGLSGVERVRGELQVRTLLQDGWGELTHEDTYKPGVSLPPLVETLAKRMADLLRTVDDLAQDVRNELDRVAQVDVSDQSDEAALESDGSRRGRDNETIDPAVTSKDLVLAETARIIEGLERPAALASIAAKLRSIFGTNTLKNWFGYPNFKSLLKDAVPDIEIVNIGPGYVIPKGAQPSIDWPTPLRNMLP